MSEASSNSWQGRTRETLARLEILLKKASESIPSGSIGSEGNIFEQRSNGRDGNESAPTEDFTYSNGSHSSAFTAAVDECNDVKQLQELLKLSLSILLLGKGVTGSLPNGQTSSSPSPVLLPVPIIQPPPQTDPSAASEVSITTLTQNNTSGGNYELSRSPSQPFTKYNSSLTNVGGASSSSARTTTSVSDNMNVTYSGSSSVPVVSAGNVVPPTNQGSLSSNNNSSSTTKAPPPPHPLSRHVSSSSLARTTRQARITSTSSSSGVGAGGGGEFELNQYSVLDEIGQGASGRVYLAYCSVSNEFRAVKSIRRPLVNSTAMQNIRNEVSIMRRLRHQNIVRLHELIDDPSQRNLFIVMQYVEKGPLVTWKKSGDVSARGPDQHLLACERIDQHKFLYYSKQITSAVQHIHHHKVVHRDIKPENILLGRDDQVFLSDFGVSHVVSSKHLDSKNNMSQTPSSSIQGSFINNISFTRATAHAPSSVFGSTVGTPAYFAPELINGVPEDQIDPTAVDVWALGVTFFQLLVGKLPFKIVPENPKTNVIPSKAILAERANLQQCQQNSSQRGGALGKLFPGPENSPLGGTTILGPTTTALGYHPHSQASLPVDSFSDIHSAKGESLSTSMRMVGGGAGASHSHSNLPTAPAIHSDEAALFTSINSVFSVTANGNTNNTTGEDRSAEGSSIKSTGSEWFALNGVDPTWNHYFKEAVLLDPDFPTSSSQSSPLKKRLENFPTCEAVEAVGDQEEDIEKLQSSSLEFPLNLQWVELICGMLEKDPVRRWKMQQVASFLDQMDEEELSIASKEQENEDIAFITGVNPISSSTPFAASRNSSFGKTVVATGVALSPTNSSNDRRPQGVVAGRPTGPPVSASSALKRIIESNRKTVGGGGGDVGLPRQRSNTSSSPSFEPQRVVTPERSESTPSSSKVGSLAQLPLSSASSLTPSRTPSFKESAVPFVLKTTVPGHGQRPNIVTCTLSRNTSSFAQAVADTLVGAVDDTSSVDSTAAERDGVGGDGGSAPTSLEVSATSFTNKEGRSSSVPPRRNRSASYQDGQVVRSTLGDGNSFRRSATHQPGDLEGAPDDMESRPLRPHEGLSESDRERASSRSVTPPQALLNVRGSALTSSAILSSGGVGINEGGPLGTLLETVPLNGMIPGPDVSPFLNSGPLNLTTSGDFDQRSMSSTQTFRPASSANHPRRESAQANEKSWLSFSDRLSQDAGNSVSTDGPLVPYQLYQQHTQSHRDTSSSCGTSERTASSGAGTAAPLPTLLDDAQEKFVASSNSACPTVPSSGSSVPIINQGVVSQEEAVAMGLARPKPTEAVVPQAPSVPQEGSPRSRFSMSRESNSSVDALATSPTSDGGRMGGPTGRLRALEGPKLQGSHPVAGDEGRGTSPSRRQQHQQQTSSPVLLSAPRNESDSLNAVISPTNTTTSSSSAPKDSVSSMTEVSLLSVI